MQALIFQTNKIGTPNEVHLSESGFTLFTDNNQFCCLYFNQNANKEIVVIIRDIVRIQEVIEIYGKYFNKPYFENLHWTWEKETNQIIYFKATIQDVWGDIYTMNKQYNKINGNEHFYL